MRLLIISALFIIPVACVIKQLYSHLESFPYNFPLPVISPTPLPSDIYTPHIMLLTFSTTPIINEMVTVNASFKVLETIESLPFKVYCFSGFRTDYFDLDKFLSFSTLDIRLPLNKRSKPYFVSFTFRIPTAYDDVSSPSMCIVDSSQKFIFSVHGRVNTFPSHPTDLKRHKIPFVYEYGEEFSSSVNNGLVVRPTVIFAPPLSFISYTRADNHSYTLNYEISNPSKSPDKYHLYIIPPSGERIQFAQPASLKHFNFQPTMPGTHYFYVFGKLDGSLVCLFEGRLVIKNEQSLVDTLAVRLKEPDLSLLLGVGLFLVVLGGMVALFYLIYRRMSRKTFLPVHSLNFAIPFI